MATTRGRRGAGWLHQRYVGAAIAVLGAVLLSVGLLQTTAGDPGGGNVECPAGTVLLAKFEAIGQDYVFEKPAGNEGVVTIWDADLDGGQWSATRPVSFVIVKGGPAAVTTSYDPPQTSGRFSNDGLPPVGQGNIPDISNVQFCGPDLPPPTTTTTVEPTTTTAVEPSTTTTTAAPTTTEAPTTAAPTTTAASTTTTAPTTTTAAPVVSTSTTVEVLGTVALPAAPDEPGAGTPSGTSGDVPGGTLPRTGAPSVPLVVAGIALLAVGGTLVALSRLRGRPADG